MAVSKINLDTSVWEAINTVTFHVGYMSACAYLNKKSKTLLLVGSTSGIPNQDWIAELPSDMKPVGSQNYIDLIVSARSVGGTSVDFVYNSSSRRIRSSHSAGVSLTYGFYILIPLQ